jgi:hypothetical protein
MCSNYSLYLLIKQTDWLNVQTPSSEANNRSRAQNITSIFLIRRSIIVFKKAGRFSINFLIINFKW